MISLLNKLLIEHKKMYYSLGCNFMNFLFKTFCRIYQLAFKIAMPILPYRNPSIFESVTDIPQILIKENKTRVLICTDKGIVNAGLLSKLTYSLKENNIEYFIYDKTTPNPQSNQVLEAYNMYVENNLSAIIAIGGGSPMDLAKIVGAKVRRPKLPISKMKGILKIRKKLPLLIAIPTTSGTGSEVTIAAVITDSDTHLKYPINDFCLIPHYAVLDPSLTLGLPPHITSTTGMDALTHAIEAFIGGSTTKETRDYSLKSIKLIVDNIKTCYFNPSNIEARKNMLIASHYAGIAFSKSYVGYVHAIAHTLGGKYNIPHGLANAIILPIMLEQYGKSIYKKLKTIAIYTNIAESSDTEEVASQKLISWIYNTNKEMNIPRYINDINLDDIDELANIASKEANPLYPVPKLYDKNELKDIYKIIKN